MNPPIAFGNGIIFVNKVHKVHVANPKRILGRIEHNGFINKGSRAPEGRIAARIKLKIPKIAPVVIPPVKPANIVASNTGICMIVKEIVGLKGIIPQLVIPRTIIKELKAPVNAIFLFVLQSNFFWYIINQD